MFLDCQSGLDLEKYSLKVRNTVTRMNPKRVNCDLVFDTILYIVTCPEFSSLEGAILVFLPGFVQIQSLYEMLESDRNFGNPER